MRNAVTTAENKPACIRYRCQIISSESCESFWKAYKDQQYIHFILPHFALLLVLIAKRIENDLPVVLVKNMRFWPLWFFPGRSWNGILEITPASPHLRQIASKHRDIKKRFDKTISTWGETRLLFLPLAIGERNLRKRTPLWCLLQVTRQARSPWSGYFYTSCLDLKTPQRPHF
jgi:hypothetical protein